MRDGVVADVGAAPALRLNVDLEPAVEHVDVTRAVVGLAALEAARAALADDVNRNPRLVVEQAFLAIAEAAPAAVVGLPD